MVTLRIDAILATAASVSAGTEPLGSRRASIKSCESQLEILFKALNVGLRVAPCSHCTNALNRIKSVPSGAPLSRHWLSF